MGFLGNLANSVTGLIGRGISGANSLINAQNVMKQMQGQQRALTNGISWPNVAGPNNNLPANKGIATSVAGGISKLATWVDG